MSAHKYSQLPFFAGGTFKERRSERRTTTRDGEEASPVRGVKDARRESARKDSHAELHESNRERLSRRRESAAPMRERSRRRRTRAEAPGPCSARALVQ